MAKQGTRLNPMTSEIPKVLSSTLVLPFLGRREYLHGTTLYRSLRALAPEDAEVCFRISKIIKTNVIRICDPKKNVKFAARLDWKSGSELKTLAVEMLNSQLPILREEYDETSILQNAKIKDGTANLLERSPFDVIATAVPLFKEILKVNQAVNTSGQWMFSRLDTLRGESSVSFPLKVCLESIRRGSLAKASVFVTNSHWADLYFSWVSVEAYSARQGS